MYLLLAFFGLAVTAWAFSAHNDRKNRRFREDTWKQVNSIFKP